MLFVIEAQVIEAQFGSRPFLLERFPSNSSLRRATHDRAAGRRLGFDIGDAIVAETRTRTFTPHDPESLGARGGRTTAPNHHRRSCLTRTAIDSPAGPGFTDLDHAPGGMT